MGGVFMTVIVGPVVMNQWFRSRNGLAFSNKKKLVADGHWTK